MTNTIKHSQLLGVDCCTAREIAQQPLTLTESEALIWQARAQIDAFLAPIRALVCPRLILSGAGSSAFLGEILAPLLASHWHGPVEAIATTDIVAAPHSYLLRDRPTLLVSFGRSGQSPETMAAIELAEQCIDAVWHLGISCNAEGVLARTLEKAPNALSLVLPDATHDSGFAMTSSFSAMLVAGLASLGPSEKVNGMIDCIAGAVASVLRDYADFAQDLAAEKASRVVFLGSGALRGLARESALKLMELTDGRVIAVHDSPLGFRHGPKAMLDGDSLAVVFISSDQLTRRYDLDLLAELRADGIAKRVVGLAGSGVTGQRELTIGESLTDDWALLFPYLAFAQLVALAASIGHGCIPDRPNPTGVVNRVVEGVRIYPLPGND
jgi:tagatose-6-phosphate ketose/aldose isomerase